MSTNDFRFLLGPWEYNWEPIKVGKHDNIAAHPNVKSKLVTLLSAKVSADVGPEYAYVEP